MSGSIQITLPLARSAHPVSAFASYASAATPSRLSIRRSSADRIDPCLLSVSQATLLSPGIVSEFMTCLGAMQTFLSSFPPSVRDLEKHDHKKAEIVKALSDQLFIESGLLSVGNVTALFERLVHDCSITSVGKWLQEHSMSRLAPEDVLNAVIGLLLDFDSDLSLDFQSLLTGEFLYQEPSTDRQLAVRHRFAGHDGPADSTGEHELMFPMEGYSPAEPDSSSSSSSDDSSDDSVLDPLDRRNSRVHFSEQLLAAIAASQYGSERLRCNILTVVLHQLYLKSLADLAQAAPAGSQRFMRYHFFEKQVLTVANGCFASALAQSKQELREARAAEAAAALRRSSVRFEEVDDVAEALPDTRGTRASAELHALTVRSPSTGASKDRTSSAWTTASTPGPGVTPTQTPPSVMSVPKSDHEGVPVAEQRSRKATKSLCCCPWFGVSARAPEGDASAYQALPGGSLN